MLAGNPNKPFDYGRPKIYEKAPFGTPNPTNPYGLGQQQVDGQTAFQPNQYGLGGGTNTQPHASVAGYSGGYGYGGGLSHRGPANSPQAVSYQTYQQMTGQSQATPQYSDYANPMDYIQAQEQATASHFVGPKEYQTWQQTGYSPYTGYPSAGPALHPYAQSPTPAPTPTPVPTPAAPKPTLLGPESFPTPAAYQQYLKSLGQQYFATPADYQHYQQQMAGTAPPPTGAAQASNGFGY